MRGSDARRRFLKQASITAGSALTAGFTGCRTPVIIAGEMQGPDLSIAHRLRSGVPFPPVTRRREVDVAIVGAGIGGLTTAWRLARAGHDNFLLIESEPNAGGNSRAVPTPAGRFPIGAHYLPLPNPEATHVRTMLSALGLLKGNPAAKKASYPEIALAYSPQERLFENGLWHETLVPSALDDPVTRDEIVRFKATIEALKAREGADGRRVFAIPVDLSSQDPKWRVLDQLPMREWLKREGYLSRGLTWWVEYGCRDDYGCNLDTTSAWVALHYFASRIGEAEHADPESVLTWPEGNGHLVDLLMAGIPSERYQRGFAMRVDADSSGVNVDWFDPANATTAQVRCRHLIWAAPGFVLARTATWQSAGIAQLAKISYAPWLTATLALREPLDWRPGAELAWDNVMMDSPSVGYIHSTHQQRRGAIPQKPVLSYYWPLTDLSPAAGRLALLEKPWQYWQERVVNDLAKPHPYIRRKIERIDFWRNGHAMARPVPGYVWGQDRAAMRQPHPRVTVAHADASGLSLFEEASWYGWLAADAVLGARK
jgi:hypothetical protein